MNYNHQKLKRKQRQIMNQIGSNQPPRLNNCSQENILNYLKNAWQLEDILLNSLVKEEVFYLNPDPLRNPLIFYLGHSAVFYINKLMIVGLLEQRINPEYETLFEIGVDPETPEQLEQAIANIEWDIADKIWQYRAQAYQEILEVIERSPLNLPITKNHPWWSIIMGIEHQRIHIETSSMLLRQLPVNLLQQPDNWPYAPSNGNPPKNEMLEVSGGIVTLGKGENDDTYGWDIDYGYSLLEISPFLVSKYMITNAEFLQFVQAGGYENQVYWSEEAWNWKTTNNSQHPKFWLASNGGYKYRAMFDEIDLPLDFPVEVNYYEAMAYCNYLSKQSGQEFRLMTEGEWHIASQKEDSEGDYNLNLKFASPTPVGSIETAKSEAGIYDLRGNVWEWLSDTLQPLSGFKPHYLYADYSAPFFDNKHQILIGGAWITNGTEASRFYRNWFRPYFYQHAGFRIAQNLS
jgi:5-histidylcysteine sulfoxide synthase